jgi:PAS domain S-box-containing protein
VEWGYKVKDSKKKLALIAKVPISARNLKEQLVYVLGDRIDIEAYYLGNIPKELDYDLVLVSTKSILPQVKALIPFGVPTLTGRRTINHDQISKVLKIPDGSKAIIVIDYYDDSQEFCSLLANSGVNHIDLIPWEPSMPVPKGVTYALTLGKAYLVPGSIKNVIDLGTRLIDITTMVEILQILGLLDEQAHMFSAKYTNTLIKLYENILNRVNEVNFVKEQLETIIQNSNDGIIFVEPNYTVTVFNKKAKEITGVIEEEILGRTVEETVPYFASLIRKDMWNDDTKKFISLGSKNVIVNVIQIGSKSEIDGWIIQLKDVTEILNMEKELHKKLKTSGHLAKYNFEMILGHSDKIKKTKELAKKLSKVDGAILITGESGVGKELFAQAIHNHSGRKNGPFVAANFSSFTDSLLESELFGYEEGAFTGAKKGGKPGLFELAHGGTIFLDEIGDVSSNLQTRLLRILQEKELMRIGDTKVRVVDVRIIAATNKDILSMVDTGSFRGDLYYRLSTLPLKVPPFRERIEDIDILIEEIIEEINKKRITPFSVSDKVMEIFYEYTWPGNIRELYNVLEYFSAVVEGPTVKIKDLPETMLENMNLALSRQEDEINHIKEKLANHINCKEYYLILNELSKVSKIGRGIGRRKIAEKLLPTKYPLTEQTVRSRIADLEKFGCAYARSGAGGTKITLFGQEMLSYFHKQMK